MSEYNCYLCASDEGILLDIFGPAGKTFREYIETCLSVKVKQSDAASKKICHKCAYELESCERFLAKYRRSKDSEEGDSASKRRGHCRLCGEIPKKLRLLQVKQGNSLNNLLHKLQQVFLDDFSKENTLRLSVCLDCRYNLDVLSDLKIIHRESVNKFRNFNENGLKLSDLPKTKTSVVTRKTTYIPEPKLSGHSSYESDTSTTSGSSSNNVTMPLKRKRVRSLKEPVKTEKATSSAFRSCEECDSQVEHGIDMYRYHRSGQTVCRDCWLTMDPERISNGKRKKLASSNAEGDTKLCAVFLKDVLSNPSKYSNIYKVEKDKEGNKTFLITDESSENEEKEKTLPKRSRTRAASSSTAGSLETITETRRGVKRASAKESKIEDETVKKGKQRRRDESMETLPVSGKATRTRNGLAVEPDSPIKTRSARSSSESTTASTSLSPETGKKSPPARRTTRAVRNTSSKSESSSNERRTLPGRPKMTKDKKKEKIIAMKNRDQRVARRARANSLTVSSVASHLEANPSEDSSTILDSPKTVKVSKARTKNAKSDSELDKPYTCSICRLGCKNKLVGKSHELTHEKQPEVKLCRVNVSASVVPPETIVEETPLEVPVSKEEEAKEESREEGNENAAVGENPEQPEEEATEKPVSEDKTESLPVTEKPEDERTTERKLDDEKENEEEIHLPLDKETETIDQTIEPAGKDQPFPQENKPETSENEENATNENKENDNSKEPINIEKEDEKNDKVTETSAETKESCEVENEPSEAPTPAQVEPEKTMDETQSVEHEISTENVEEKSRGDDEDAETLGAAEPMEVTETEEKEESIENAVDPVVEDIEKAGQDNCEEAAKATDAGHQEKPDRETEDEDSTPKATSETNKTAETTERVAEDAEKEEKENSTEQNEQEVEKDAEEKEKESSTDHNDKEKEKDESNEKHEEEKDEEKEETEESNEGDKQEEEPETTVDSSRDEEVSLVVEDCKEDETPTERSEKEDEEKKEETSKTDEVAEAAEPSNESLTIAAECVREVFDLATAEVKKRLENENSKQDKCTIAETLENITLEIENGSDMPSLELEAASNGES